MLYGAKGPRLYDPNSKYQMGGWLDSYQGGGITINSEADYQKSLLMKNKTKERMDAERAWVAKKVAAQKAQSAPKPAYGPTPDQQAALFGMKSLPSETSQRVVMPAKTAEIKAQEQKVFDTQVKQKMKDNPNWDRQKAVSAVNVERAYQGPGVIKEAQPEQGIISKTIEVAANPFNALDAYVQSGYVPDYFSQSKDAVNPLNTVYQMATPAGWYTTGAQALYNKLPKDVEQGNWLGVGEDVLMALPLGIKATQLGRTYIPRGYKPVEVPAQLPGSPNNLSNKIINPIYNRTPLSKEMEPFISKKITPPSREEEIFNSFFSPERQRLNELKRTTFYNQQSQVIPPPQQMGFPNPLGIVDRLIPRPLGPAQLYSPFNFIPGYGKELTYPGPGMVGFRKFGNSLNDVIESQSLRPRGGFKMGAKQVSKEGNWAEPNKTDETYSGVFAAEMDPQNPGSNIKLEKWPRREGVVGTTKDGNVAIPLTDQGLQFHRRLPFSTKYVPINKQKLINNQFQLATQLPHVQSLVEKYGAYAGLALVSGYMMGGKEQALKNLETVNKYSIDPVINWTKKQWNEFDKLINPSVEQKKAGGSTRKSGKKLVNYTQKPNFVKTQSTSWLDKYK